MNVLTYDYHTSFDPETDHHAPLKAKPGNLDVETSKLNVEWTINYLIKLGAPRGKIILGIPTYGRSFTLADASNNGVNAPAEGPGDAGVSTREKGYLAFYEICQKVEDEDWQLHRLFPHIEVREATTIKAQRNSSFNLILLTGTLCGEGQAMGSI